MKILIALSLAAAIAIAAGAAFVYFGVYNVAATEQHTAPVYWLLDIATRRAVVERAREIETPALDDVALIERGFRLFDANCRQCHGAPGVAPDAISLGMTPVPANLALTAREWKPAELYWVAKYGIKMSGMPAWEFRLPDDDLWAIVAFVRRMPELSVLEYKEIARSLRGVPAETVVAPPDATPAQGDQGRGKTALSQYACGTCHEIPGVVGATKTVGPPLAGIASRKYLAGVLPNTPQNMVRWLRAPQEVDPRTAMPDLRVSDRDARDMAAYLYTLE